MESHSVRQLPDMVFAKWQATVCSLFCVCGHALMFLLAPANGGGWVLGAGRAGRLLAHGPPMPLETFWEGLMFM